MFGFEDMLMQAAANNATVVIPATDIIDQASATVASLAGLITVIGGIVTYAITQFRKVKKEELTERDKWILEAMKSSQIVAQKSAEEIGNSKELIRTLYTANVPEDKRKEAEATVGPALEQANMRLKAANEQAAMIKAKAVQIFGEAGDVDKDPTVPREDSKISMKLRTA